MKISITDRAIKWFESELLLDKGDAVRFFGKVYGKTDVHEGFSVGMNAEQPNSGVFSKTEVNGITYFAGLEDDWFFRGYNLEVDYDKDIDAPVYYFEEIK